MLGQTAATWASKTRLPRAAASCITPGGGQPGSAGAAAASLTAGPQLATLHCRALHRIAIELEVLMATGYSRKEVADYVGVHPDTVVRWLEKKKVEVRRKKNARGHYVFSEADRAKFKEYAESIEVVDD